MFVCVCVCRVKLPTELLTSPFPLFRTCHAVVKCSSSQRYDTYGASQWRLCSPLSLIIIFFFLARDSIPLFFWNLPPFSVCLCDIPSIHINILSCDTHSTSIGTEMLILPGGGRGSEKVFQNYRFPLILCVCVIWPDKSVMISITKMTIKVQCVVQKHPSTILRLRDGGDVIMPLQLLFIREWWPPCCIALSVTSPLLLRSLRTHKSWRRQKDNYRISQFLVSHPECASLANIWKVPN